MKKTNARQDETVAQDVVVPITAVYAGESPISADVPFWLTACVRLKPPRRKNGAEITGTLANAVIVAAQALIADRLRTREDVSTPLDREQIARRCGLGDAKRAGWLFDYLELIGFLRVQRHFGGPGRGRDKDTFEVFVRPPLHYIGPHTHAELERAQDEFELTGQATLFIAKTAGQPQGAGSRTKVADQGAGSRTLVDKTAGQPQGAGSRTKVADQGAGSRTLVDKTAGQPQGARSGTISDLIDLLPPVGDGGREEIEPVPGGTAEPPATGQDEKRQAVRELVRRLPWVAWGKRARRGTWQVSPDEVTEVVDAVCAVRRRTELSDEQVLTIGAQALHQAKGDPAGYVAKAFSKHLGRYLAEPLSENPVPLPESDRDDDHQVSAAGLETAVDARSAPGLGEETSGRPVWPECGTCDAREGEDWRGRTVTGDDGRERPCPTADPRPPRRPRPDRRPALTDTMPARKPRPARTDNDLPPHNHNAERSVLGAMLLSGDAVATCLDLLAPEDFSLPAHGAVWSVITDLFALGQPHDPLVVEHELRVRGDATRIDRVTANTGVFLADLVAVAAVDVGYHAELVAEAAVNRRLAEAGVRISQLPHSAPGTDLVERAQRILDEVTGQARSTGGGLVRVADLRADALSHLDDLQAGRIPPGLETGFTDLDEALKGLKGGQLVVVAGRPGMGKTTLGVDIARHVSVRHGLTSAIFSLEMSRNELWTCLIAAEGKVRRHDLFTPGALQPADWDRVHAAAQRLDRAPLFIDDDASTTPTQIRARAKQLKARHGGLDLIVVDYLQLMTSGRRAESRQVEVSELSRTLKLVAKELDVPVIALSQLNRGPEQRADKRPMLSDLRESGALEQDADIVILIHRPDQYDREDPRAGEADLIIAKHRAGPTATITVVNQLHYARFADLAREDEPGGW
uniref:replicative DNA helicase n=1 Tax=Saccharothrix espanaensis TaxID=103731 RepID=UPI003F496974